MRVTGRRYIGAVASLALLGAVPAYARSTKPSPEAEVRAAIEGLVNAFMGSDPEKIIAYVSRDMHLIHPLRGEVTYDDFASGLRSAPPSRAKRVIVTELDRLYVAGDLAVTGITWRTTITAPDGKVTLRGERDQEVWRREADGKWRLFRGASFPLDLNAARK